MVAVILLFELFARQNRFFRIDYYNEFAAVHMRCEFGTMLSAQNVSRRRSGFAKRLAGRIEHIPLAFDGFAFRHERGHFKIYSSIIGVKI